MNLALFLFVIGSFVCAVVLGLATEIGKPTGVLPTIGGITSIVFSRRLASAQQELASKPFIPSHWREIRPLTFVLWGVGVALIGLFQILGV